MKKKRVLLAGSTGYLGRYLAQQLKQSSYDSTLIVRDIRNSGFDPESYDLIEAEVTHRETLKGVCKGFDFVISAVGITRQKEGLSYLDVDFQANANLVDEAVAAGVKKFMYIGVLNGENLRHIKMGEAKERLVDYLKTSGLDYCIVRPNGFFSDMKDFLQMARRGKIYLFGDGRQLLNPIHGDDLAKVCVRALEWDSKELEIGGPDLLTQNDIARLALRSCGKPERIKYLPDWMRKLSLRFVRTFLNTNKYGSAEFFLTTMAMDMIAPQFGCERLRDFFQAEALHMNIAIR